MAIAVACAIAVALGVLAWRPLSGLSTPSTPLCSSSGTVNLNGTVWTGDSDIGAVNISNVSYWSCTVDLHFPPPTTGEEQVLLASGLFHAISFNVTGWTKYDVCAYYRVAGVEPNGSGQGLILAPGVAHCVYPQTVLSADLVFGAILSSGPSLQFLVRGP